MFRIFRSLSSLCSLCLCGESLLADPPVATYLFPAGGQRGTTVTVPRRRAVPEPIVPLEMIGPGVEASPVVRRTEIALVRGAASCRCRNRSRQEDYPRTWPAASHRRRRPARRSPRPAADVPGGDAATAVRGRRLARGRRGGDRRRAGAGRGDSCRSRSTAASSRARTWTSGPSPSKKGADTAARWMPRGSARRSMPASTSATRRQAGRREPSTAAGRDPGPASPPPSTATTRSTSRTPASTAGRRSSTG